MILIENLHKHYGTVRALDGLDMIVEPGNIYGFLGPNGAGKTTTLRILTGLAGATSGRASVAGVDLKTDGRTFKQSEVESWMDTFMKAGERGLKVNSLDETTIRQREIKVLRAKVGELVLELDARKKWEALNGRDETAF